jgi:hypothetical protein
VLIGALVHRMEASSRVGPTSFVRRPSGGAASDVAPRHRLEAARLDCDDRVPKVACQRAKVGSPRVELR